MKKVLRIGAILAVIICSSFIPFNGDKVQAGVTVVFYSNANPETTSVDGNTYDKDNNLIWSALIAEPGNFATDINDEDWFIYISASTTSNQWARLARPILLFDTSAIPDDAIIYEASLSVRSTASKVTFGSNLPDVNVYTSNPDSNTALAAGDFDSLGNVALCDTPITYTAWKSTDWNTWSFNDTGIALIDKSGVSKFGLRNANYDVAGVAPPSWSSGAYMVFWGNFSERGTGYKPTLTVKYTYVPTGVSSFTVVNNGDNTSTAEWILSTYALGVRLVRDYIAYPIDRDSPHNIYEGTGITVDDIGLFPYVDKFYRIYEYNEVGWSSYSQATVGREVMNVTIEGTPQLMTMFPPAIYGVAIGLVLILINLKAKMALLWLAAAICFIGVFFDPALSDTYYQAAAIVIIIACLISGFFGYKSKKASLG